MSISGKTILRGLLYRLFTKKPKYHFPPLTWVQEKKLKHEDDKEIKLIKLNGLRINYIKPYELLHTYTELFQDEIYRFTTESVTPLIVDCGANIGLSVLYFKKLFPGSRILAFEPDKENFKLLKQNVLLNGFENVECRESAVWINNGKVSFVSEGSQASQIGGNDSGNTVQIRAERLADILQNGNVDFLKIDIEGAEFEVIKDCAPHLKNVTNCFVEYHGKVTDTDKLSELLDILQVHFCVYIKLAADNINRPFVERTSNGPFDVQLNIFCYRRQTV